MKKERDERVLVKSVQGYEILFQRLVSATFNKEQLLAKGRRKI